MVMATGCVSSMRLHRKKGFENKALESSSIQSGGRERTYLIYVPDSYDGSKETPLVLAFHGDLGAAKEMDKLTHLSKIAKEKNFIVVYPDGVNHNWNDGRAKINASIDDVGFTRDLIAKLGSQYNIDRSAIFATGISNGGFFCNRLACEMSETFAAIAPVAALLCEAPAQNRVPAKPISVLLMVGESDPLVPYNGGPISGSRFSGKGRCLSASASVDFWVRANGCSTTPTRTELPDKNPSDKTRVRTETYSGGKEQSEVELVTIEGGGHTWPGGWQYLPTLAVGRTSRDIDGSEVIWNFFDSHRRD